MTNYSLPPGLALDANGRISGVPTAEGLFYFVITVTNGAGSASLGPP